ncbi:hypothetical protein V2G26_013455 [Clonostachys chloroleuca]
MVTGIILEVPKPCEHTSYHLKHSYFKLDSSFVVIGSAHSIRSARRGLWRFGVAMYLIVIEVSCSEEAVLLLSCSQEEMRTHVGEKAELILVGVQEKDAPP